MKLAFTTFRGEVPIIGKAKLPLEYASAAVNSKLTSNDLEAYPDIGAPFQLAKAAPINSVARIVDSVAPATYDWLQWTQAEVVNGPNVDAAPGPVPGDTTGRLYITGLDVPRFTNSYYATDPSQQGAHVLHAYPYVTQPLGVPNPTAAPPRTTPTAPSNTDDFDFAQATYVQSVTVAAAGTGYAVGDVLYLIGGTLPTGFTHNTGAARVRVTDADPTTGAITGTELVVGGFYTLTAGPPDPATTDYGPGAGAGVGATFHPNNVTPPDTVGSGMFYVFPGWGAFEEDNGAGFYHHYRWNGGGWQEVSFGQGDLAVVYSNQAFSLISAAGFTFQADVASALVGADYPDLVMQWTGAFDGQNQVVGPTLVLSIIDGTFGIYQTVTGTNGSAVSGTPLAQVTGIAGLATNTFYRITLTMTATTSASQPGFTVSATLATQAAPGVILASLSDVFTQYAGEQLGIGGNHRGTHNNVNTVEIQNVSVSVNQPASAASIVTTEYVYTWIQRLPQDVVVSGPFQESGPSPASDPVNVYLVSTTNPPTRTEVEVTIPAAPAVGIAGAPSYIVAANLYRLVADTQGNESFTLVNVSGPIPVSTSLPTTYDDSALDSAIGPTILPSFDPNVPGSLWEPPPADLRNIVAMPNGVMAGISGNTLCLSAQGYPHAWPQSNRYTTETSCIGLAILQVTALILTQANPYTGFGSDPAQFTMTKEPSLYGCTSKRSISTHRVLGAIYAAPTGIAYFRGQGELSLVKSLGDQPPFSYEQWQALNPASINGVVHNGAYWFSYTTLAGVKGSYVVDLEPSGRGVVELDFHVTTWALDQLNGLLYLVPDKSVYPINGSVIAAASNIISQWEGSSSTKRTQSWTHGDTLQEAPKNYIFGRVRAEDFNDVTLIVSNENGVCFNHAVTSPLIFVMAQPGGKPASRWTVQVVGTSTVNTVELAESASEF